MKIFLKLLFLCGIVLMITKPISGIATKGTGSCPIKETVRICLPRCFNDYECVGDKRCCPNACGTNSCAEVSPVTTGNDQNTKKSVVTCANQKCQPGQKCVSGNSMKRPKCSW